MHWTKLPKQLERESEPKVIAEQALVEARKLAEAVANNKVVAPAAVAMIQRWLSLVRTTLILWLCKAKTFG
jgi:hypothetical protein